jgi:hypothetical protein
VASKLAQRAVYLGRVRERQRRIVVGQSVQAIDLEVDRHPLGRRRLQLTHGRLLFPRLHRKLAVEELGTGSAPSGAR